MKNWTAQHLVAHSESVYNRGGFVFGKPTSDVYFKSVKRASDGVAVRCVTGVFGFHFNTRHDGSTQASESLTFMERNRESVKRERYICEGK